MSLCVISETSALVLAVSVTVIGLLLTADSVEMCRRKGQVDLRWHSSMLYSFHNFVPVLIGRAKHTAS